VAQTPVPRRKLGAALQLALSGRPQVEGRSEEHAPGAGVLAGEARAKAFQALLDRPLLHISGVARTSHMAAATAAWHLAVLEKAGLAQRMRGGREARFFVTGTVDEGSRAELLALRAPLAQPVLAAVAESPGLSLAEVAAEVKASPQSVLRARGPLEALRFLETQREGRSVRTYPAEGLPQFLAKRTADLPLLYEKVEGALRAAGETCQVARKARGEIAFSVGRRGAKRDFQLRADGPLRPSARR
jgi:DNA-binding transcriptional ArsR family regulator